MNVPVMECFAGATVTAAAVTNAAVRPLLFMIRSYRAKSSSVKFTNIKLVQEMLIPLLGHCLPQYEEGRVINSPLRRT